MGTLILDASVVIGLLDRADAHHQAAVDAVEAADAADSRVFVPASAYSETLVAFARAGRLREASDAIAAMGITVAPLTATMAECAAELRARHRGLRLPDAIVLACACARDLEGELLSYDDRLERIANDPHR
jgi:predicted nucleic acid-binding protein